LLENTLIIFTSDNGPDAEVNTAGHLRGVKASLYEGGFREPFIAWWPSVIPQGKNGSVNERSVVAGIDLPLIFLTAAGVAISDSIAYDGENMFEAIAGLSEPLRKKPLYWIRPPDRPGYNGDNDPDLAIRKGPYKLLMDTNGTNLQLYDIVKDETESNNLTNTLPKMTAELKTELLNWYHSYPHTIDTTKISY
jgi:arylsulfatase A-like enzyme